MQRTGQLPPAFLQDFHNLGAQSGRGLLPGRGLVVLMRGMDPERVAAVKFTREILEKRLHRPMGEVFEVSAAERMEGRGPFTGLGKAAGKPASPC